MALFGRSLKSGGEDGTLDGDSDSRSDSNSRRTIGALLKQTRQSKGGDLDRIGATLRIRPSYLAAIEDGRYDRLPGAVYAVGFIRAYALHLGLDGDEAVRQLKQEMSGFEVSRDLSFPMPLAERSIPGGTMILAALILALCGYGLWYYVSTGERTRPERVSAVPHDIAAETAPVSGQPGASAAPSTAARASSAPASATAPAATTPQAVASAGASGLPTGLTTAATPAANSAPAMTASAPAASMAPGVAAPAASPNPAVPSSSSLPSSSRPAIETATLAPPAAAPAPAGMSNAGAQVTAPATPPQTAAAPANAALPSATATPAANPAETPDEGAPHVYGVPASVPSRILIRASKVSWVQIRGADGHVITQRTLHPGDSVRVPDERGLVLRTGNAPGIAIDVDGKPTKPLRPSVRTLELDADALASGKTPLPPDDSQDSQQDLKNN